MLSLADIIHKCLPSIPNLLIANYYMKNLNCSGIYIIRHKKSKKCYVGKDSNLGKRVENHFKGYSKDCKAIHNAIQKHGKEEFEYELIPYPGISQKALSEVERWQIQKNTSHVSQNGYNLNWGQKPTEKIKKPITKGEWMFIRTHARFWYEIHHPVINSIRKYKSNFIQPIIFVLTHHKGEIKMPQKISTLSEIKEAMILEIEGKNAVEIAKQLTENALNKIHKEQIIKNPETLKLLKKINQERNTLYTKKNFIHDIEKSKIDLTSTQAAHIKKAFVTVDRIRRIMKSKIWKEYENEFRKRHLQLVAKKEAEKYHNEKD